MQLIDWHIIKKKANVLSVFFPFSVTIGVILVVDFYGILLSSIPKTQPRDVQKIGSGCFYVRKGSGNERIYLRSKQEFAILSKRSLICFFKWLSSSYVAKGNFHPGRDCLIHGLSHCALFFKTDDIYVYITATAQCE